MKSNHGTLVPVREELVDSFKQGHRVSYEDLTVEIDSLGVSKNPTHAAYRIIADCRQELANQGIPLAPLPNGEIGVPETEEEVTYAMRRYQGRVASLVAHSLLLKTYATNKKILPDGYTEKRISLPSFTS